MVWFEFNHINDKSDCFECTHQRWDIDHIDLIPLVLCQFKCFFAPVGIYFLPFLNFVVWCQCPYRFAEVIHFEIGTPYTERLSDSATVNVFLATLSILTTNVCNRIMS